MQIVKTKELLKRSFLFFHFCVVANSYTEVWRCYLQVYKDRKQ